MFEVNDLCLFAAQRGSILYKIISIPERLACFSRSISVDLLCHGNVSLQWINSSRVHSDFNHLICLLLLPPWRCIHNNYNTSLTNNWAFKWSFFQKSGPSHGETIRWDQSAAGFHQQWGGWQQRQQFRWLRLEGLQSQSCEPQGFEPRASVQDT